MQCSNAQQKLRSSQHIQRHTFVVTVLGGGFSGGGDLQLLGGTNVKVSSLLRTPGDDH